MIVNFKVEPFNAPEEELSFTLNSVLVVGYSGSNTKKIMEHIEELEKELGVPAPKKIPTIFECSREVLTFESEIGFVGNMTSGEAEYLIIKHSNKIYIGVGSDHTDRKLESVSVLKSKQVCPKPLSKKLWLYEDIKEYWNNIRIESYQTINNEEILYQKGNLSEILPVEKIIQELENRVGNIENSIIFSGTVPLVSGFKYGSSFRGILIDDMKKRSLELNYSVKIISEEEK